MSESNPNPQRDFLTVRHQSLLMELDGIERLMEKRPLTSECRKSARVGRVITAQSDAGMGRKYLIALCAILGLSPDALTLDNLARLVLATPEQRLEAARRIGVKLDAKPEMTASSKPESQPLTKNAIGHKIETV